MREISKKVHFLNSEERKWLDSYNTFEKAVVPSMQLFNVAATVMWISIPQIIYRLGRTVIIASRES